MLPHDLVMRIAIQVCMGLSKAHESDVIHRESQARQYLCGEIGWPRAHRVKISRLSAIAKLWW